MHYIIKFSVITMSLSGVLGLDAAIKPAAKRQKVGRDDASDASLFVSSIQFILNSPVLKEATGVNSSHIENNAASAGIFGYNVLADRNVNIFGSHLNPNQVVHQSELELDADGVFYRPKSRARNNVPPVASGKENNAVQNGSEMTPAKPAWGTPQVARSEYLARRNSARLSAAEASLRAWPERDKIKFWAGQIEEGKVFKTMRRQQNKAARGLVDLSQQ